MTRKNDDVFEALKTGHRLHEYRIERVLGHGGFGITYLAYDVLLNAPFAIKEFLPPSLVVRTEENSVTVRSESVREQFAWARNRFLNEARALARFQHPNLVRVNRIFEANGTVYFVMDFVSGGTLGQSLKRQPQVSEEQVLGILLPLMSGLRDVHASGVLHRDIKPANIILRQDGSPILIDFGAARQTFTANTKSMMNVVTAGYAPLEQYSEDMPQGPWTDIYGLGAVAYRMVCGHKPKDAIERLRNESLAPASELAQGRFSEQLLKAIDWALAVQPENRPQSLGEWQAALPSLDASKTGLITDSSAPELAQTQAPQVKAEDTTAIRPRAEVAASQASPPPRPTTSPHSRWRSLALPLAALGLSAFALISLLRPGTPAPEPQTGVPQPAPVVRENLSDEAFIEQGEQRIAAGQIDALKAQVAQRLAADSEDAAALVLSGHLAFIEGRRPSGIADYAIALANQPALADNPLLARNLVSALGWTTATAESVIRTYLNEQMLQQLAVRAASPGQAGRDHARRILSDLREEHRIDELKFAQIELLERKDCNARIAAIDTIARMGDSSDIPRLEAQLGNRCLREALEKAILHLQ